MTFALSICLNTVMFKYLCVSFLLILSCCSKTSTAPQKRPLHLNLTQDPSTFDPRKASDFSSATVNFFLFEGLTRSTPENIYEPALAEKIEVHNKGLTYIFKLKKAYWSNRQPITAYDFERSWKELLDPKFPCPNAHMFYPIVGAEEAKKGVGSIDKVGIRAMDASTLRVDLHSVTPYFLELTAFCTFFPYNEDRLGKPVFSGPYQLKEYRTKDHLDIEKNPSYWGKERIRLDTIRFYLIDEGTTALEMFERGEIDLLGTPFTPLPIDSIPSLKKHHNLNSTDAIGTSLVSFNTVSKIFRHEKIRQAIILSIDRREIVENLTFLGEQVATSLLPPKIRGGNFEEYTWITDRQKARELLAEALEDLDLKKQDIEPHLILSASGNFTKIAQVIQEQIRQALDIHVVVEPLEMKIYLDRLYQHNYDMAGCLILAQFSDPLSYLERFKYRSHLRNYPYFEDAEYIQLIDKSYKAASGNERMRLLNEAERILIESGTLLPIYHFKNGFVVSNEVKNIKVFPQGTICLEEVEIG